MFDDLIIEPANEGFKDVINNIIKWFKDKLEWLNKKIQSVKDKVAKTKLGQAFGKLKGFFFKAKNAKTAEEAIEAQNQAKPIVEGAKEVLKQVETPKAEEKKEEPKVEAKKEEPKAKEKKAESIKRDPNNFGMFNKKMATARNNGTSPRAYGEGLSRKRAAEESMVAFADWCDDLMIATE